jgi:oligopeptidase B
MTADQTVFQKEMFEEMKARIKEDDESVPYLYNGYYITCFETGKGYPIYSKKRRLMQQKKLCLTVTH